MFILGTLRNKRQSAKLCIHVVLFHSEPNVRAKALQAAIRRIVLAVYFYQQHMMQWTSATNDVVFLY